MKFDWDKEDRYHSNGGHGPLVARILCVTDKEAAMERRNIKGGCWVRFKLPLKYLRSKRCGWRLVGN